MPYPHILQRPPVLVREHVIQLIQRLKSLNDVSKHRVPPIQVVDPVRQGDEELASTSAYLLTLQRRSDGHRNCPLVRVFEMRDDFRREISRNIGIALLLLGGYERPDGLSARSCCRWVSSLRKEIFRDYNNMSDEARKTRIL